MIIVMNRQMCLSVDCKLYEISQNFKKKIVHAKKKFDSRLNKDFDNHDVSRSEDE